MSRLVWVVLCCLWATPVSAHALEPPTPPRAPAPEPAPADEASPVVRAEAGDWGMFFRFGGLSTLSTTGNARDIDGMIVTQVGMRRVFEGGWILPFSFGSGIRSLSEPGAEEVAAGMDASVGVEYHFREWRRISPFVGVSLGAGVAAPSGQVAHVGLGFGPTLGIEYYVADRVSLIAQYLLTMQLEIIPEGDVSFTGNTMSGGAATLVVYF